MLIMLEPAHSLPIQIEDDLLFIFSFHSHF